jgi:D-arabinose 1-dehydrogenase-like Zn-dependent alcohol dehydrogenase
MRSYQIIDWGQPLEERVYDNPEPTGTEVLLRVDACGVCHSDLHIWDGYFDLGEGVKAKLADRGAKLPLTLGHEPVGTVVAVGPDAKDVAVGDKRVVYPWVGCRDCEACNNGEDQFCPTPKFIGARIDGGYADHVIVPHSKYLVDYEGVPTELACIYACSGLTAYSALRKVQHLTANDWLLMIGAGGVGFNGLLIAKAMTNAKILVADVDPTKRSAARQAGADETVDNSEPDAIEKVQAITGGGPRAAMDFVGRAESARFGFDVLPKRGTLVIVGMFGGAMSMSVPTVPQKALTIRGSYVGSLEELKSLMGLVRTGKVGQIPYETRPLSACNSALDDLRDGKVLGRVVLTPNAA